MGLRERGRGGEWGILENNMTIQKGNKTAIISETKPYKVVIKDSGVIYKTFTRANKQFAIADAVKEMEGAK